MLHHSVGSCASLAAPAAWRKPVSATFAGALKSWPTVVQALSARASETASAIFVMFVYAVCMIFTSCFFQGRSMTAATATGGFEFVGQPHGHDAGQQDGANDQEAIVVRHHIGFAAHDAVDRLQGLVAGRDRIGALVHEGRRQLVDTQLRGAEKELIA